MQSLSTAFVAAALVAAPAMALLGDARPAWADESEVSRKAVDEYADLESKGKNNNIKTLEDFRNKYKIRRTIDGRVQLKSSKGDWWSVRLDMEVSGGCPHA